MTEALLIIGNGMAATRLIDELSSCAPGRYRVTVVGDEPRLAYNRVLLSSLLAGEVDAQSLSLKPADWWRRNTAEVITGTRAVEIDTRAKSVWLRGGRKLTYGKLVLATGSEAVRLPIPGADLAGVVTFRTKQDAKLMLDSARPGRRAVVIGGGLLGLEAAHGLAKAGMSVSLVHLMDRLMERQLDACASSMLKSAIEESGIEVLLNAESAAVQGRRKATGLRLKDGRVVNADLVVMAVGVRPDVRLARGADLKVMRGIVVGDRLETSAADIFAIGECAEHRGIAYGLVAPAYEQAGVLARHLAGDEASYEGSLAAANLKVSGLGVFSAGDFMGGEGTESIVLRDPVCGTYRKVVLQDEKLVGAILFGDTADALWYLDLIRSGKPVASLRDDLIFGPAFTPSMATAA